MPNTPSFPVSPLTDQRPPKKTLQDYLADIEGLSVQELSVLLDHLSSEHESRMETQRAAAVAKVLLLCYENGIFMEDLSNALIRSGSGGVKARALYMHPNDPRKTWSGRGRQPEWVSDCLKDGMTLTDLTLEQIARSVV